MQTLSPYHIEQTDLHELYQALYFLHNVAATKLVDGAWLYGLISRWHEPSCHDLVRTYLEELGDGEPEHNHVLIYRQLMASHDLPPIDALPSDRFVQGTLQLALGHLADEFLPEVTRHGWPGTGSRRLHCRNSCTPCPKSNAPGT